MKAKLGLFLAAEPYGGGTFQYDLSILDAVASLPKDQFEVIVFYTQEHWDHYIKAYGLNSLFSPISKLDALMARAWRGLQLPISLWRKLSPFFNKTVRKVLAQACDLWIFPSQDVWTYQMPVKAIGVIHDLMHRYERQFPEVGSAATYRRREYHFKNLCAWSNGVFVESKMGKKQVLEAYSVLPSKIHILPLLPPRYIFQEGVPEGFDSRYKLPKKFLFYPAQFWEHKNHKRLIRAMRYAQIQFPDLELVLVGAKKNGYESTHQLVEELGMTFSVHFLGYIPDEDMPEFYRRARALIMPTYFGPSNIPPLEAFALGCPVAISGIHGMQEQYGDAALCFDPASESQIKDALIKLWQDDLLCAELKRNGSAKARLWDQKAFNEGVAKVIIALLNTDS